MISGSYPGEMYLFRGDGRGGFLKGEKVTDAKGAVLKVGRATVVFVHDWEGDGDLDLLVGDIEGRVSLVPNESDDKTLKLGRPVRLAAGGREIRAPGRNSGPVMADWDGDGRHDLVLGCGDGSVLLFRDTAEEGAPVLAAPTTLVSASKSWPMKDQAGTSPCGSRAKLAIHDWDGDGKDDLLLGDVTWKRLPPPDLTEEQIARRDELRAEQKKRSAALQKLWAERGPEYDRQAREALGLDEALPEKELVESLSEEKRTEYYRKRSAIMLADPEYKKASDGNREIWQELRRYEGKTETHGYVWLFRRKG